MSQLDQYVNTSLDDWTTGDPASGTANTLTVRYMGSLSLESLGYCRIDTSAIPDDATITGATFYWYDHAYLYPKGAGINSSIQIYDGSSSYVTIYNFITYHIGAMSHALEAGELQYIVKDNKTWFKFVTYQNGSKDRTWDIRAYDGYSGSNEQPRLVVDYTEASSGIQKVQIILC